jgi:hypothetical protein
MVPMRSMVTLTLNEEYAKKLEQLVFTLRETKTEVFRNGLDLMMEKYSSELQEALNAKA